MESTGSGIMDIFGIKIRLYALKTTGSGIMAIFRIMLNVRVCNGSYRIGMLAIFRIKLRMYAAESILMAIFNITTIHIYIYDI